MSLPMRLDAVLDDIGMGAVIRHQTGDFNAVIVEYVPSSDRLLAVKLDWDGSGKLKKKHYKVFSIEDSTEWMALTLGTDYALGDGE